MKKFWLTLFLSLVCFLSSFVWTSPAAAYTESEKLLLQSWRLVNQAYVDETFNGQNWWLVRQKLLKKHPHTAEETYEAIEEMLATLDDPYTRLLRPAEYKNLKISTSGEFSGIGLQIHLNPETKQIEVVTPLPNSPAESAGLKPKDVLLEIDGFDVSTLSLDQAASKIRGPLGTKVMMKVQSPEDNQVKTLEIVRDRLSLSSVIAKLDRTSSNIPIGNIRLNSFSGNSAQDVAEAIAKLEKAGAKGYILDLRNNPGGLLQAGIEIARLWLKPSTIVYTVNRQGTLGGFDSTGEPLTEAPLVVLVNQGSASASEILAGALQDNDRAILVGEKTFGKGLIQSLFELPEGLGLAITVAKYETPKHKDINKLGITPDQLVSQDPITYQQIATPEDKQYQVAVNCLSDFRQPSSQLSARLEDNNE
jgi:carboxyl-terminal processing protease